MKHKVIFASIVATLALAVGCTKEADQHYLKEIKVSTSYVSLATTEATNSSTITVTATDSWTISVPEDAAKWLTVTPTSGSAGETQVTFSAAAGEGNTAEVIIKCGEKTQRVNVIQGLATVSNATCKEVLDGPDSKTYRVTGVVTKIVNTTYGNWYLNDGTGEVYIYGTLDSKGATKNFLSWGLEVGDEITVEGPKTTYNGTVELVDVTVVKITKSLIKVDAVMPEDATIAKEGGDVTVTLANKGGKLGVIIPEDAQSWLGISLLAGDVVVFTAAPNEGGDREATVTFTTTDGKKDYTAELVIAQKGAILDITAAEFNKLADGTALYRVKGVVTQIVMDKTDATKYNKYGNFYIQDGTGEVYVYGLLPEAGGQTAQDVLTSKGVKVGDVITVVGPKGSYKDSPQMVNGYYVEHTSVRAATAAEFNALADGSDLYLISGKVTEIVMDKADATKYNKYGNFYVEDETGKVYVYGLVPAITGASGQDLLTKLGVKVGDFITVVGPKGSYKNAPQMVNGYYVAHEEGTADDSGDDSGDESGDDSGDDSTSLGQFDSNVTFTKGTSCYDDNVLNVVYGETTTENVKNLKFGTGSKFGDGTVTLPAGTKKVTFYAVAWKGTPATFKISLALSWTDTTINYSEFTTKEIAANDGASNNSPYNITVTDTDKYEIEFPQAIGDAGSYLKFETTSDAEDGKNGKRAFLFGVQASK